VSISNVFLDMKVIFISHIKLFYYAKIRFKIILWMQFFILTMRSQTLIFKLSHTLWGFMMENRFYYWKDLSTLHSHKMSMKQVLYFAIKIFLNDRWSNDMLESKWYWVPMIALDFGLYFSVKNLFLASHRHLFFQYSCHLICANLNNFFCSFFHFLTFFKIIIFCWSYPIPSINCLKYFNPKFICQILDCSHVKKWG